ncbi:hypothetical protein L6452_40656 [Arctium lappa]|uniref:Uncharacterized protein n=1 Tax=Arctium lappa TaxID=4217 RepID=A0ACB8XLW0_ARCLA|nr:hypothetical protein L6452_40656 [Arctium lappa]
MAATRQQSEGDDINPTTEVRRRRPWKQRDVRDRKNWSEERQRWIQTHANSGLSMEALDVYKEMCEQGVVMDKYTFTFILKASGIIKDEKTGCVIHGRVVKCGFYSNVFVGNALVAFYAKCHMIEACRSVFEEILQKDLVSWNSVISGYTTNGRFIEALELFHTLLHNESIGAPDHATFKVYQKLEAEIGPV